MKLSHLRDNKGASTLIVVLMAVMIITIIMVPIALVSYIQTRQSTRFFTSQSAYFAAEGALFETIQHLKQDPNWPSVANYVDQYTIGTTTIDREIIDGNPIQIIIKASNKGSNRRIEAQFTPGDEDAGPSPFYDIMMVFDTSGSMCNSRCNSTNQDLSNPTESIEFLKVAALSFVDKISTNPQNQIGYVAFHSGIREVQPLTSSFNTVRTMITNLDAGGGTNIARAVNRTTSELNGPLSRPGVEKLIIFFSDGVPQHSHLPQTCAGDLDEPCDCDDNECSQASPDSGYEPRQQNPINTYYGSFCTNDGFNQATLAKSNGFTFYSIFLITQAASQCGDPARIKELGQWLLFRMSSETDSLQFDENIVYEFYKETDNAADLESIFDDIADDISTGSFLQYQETDPQP